MLGLLTSENVGIGVANLRQNEWKKKREIYEDKMQVEQWHNRNCRGLFIPSILLHHSSNVPSDISKGLEITTCVFLSISHVEVFDCTLHLDYAAHAVFTLTFRPNHPSSLAAVVYATTSTRWTFASRPSAPRSATQGSLSWETRRH